MSNAPFVHLHVHSEYSLIDSVVRVADLVNRVRELGQPAVALTDFNNLFALPKFYRAALDVGVKPLVGAEFAIAPRAGERYRALLLCMNEGGYRNLCALLTRAYRYGQHGGNTALDEEWLTTSSSAGLIMLSGGVHSDLARALAEGKQDALRRRVARWQELFGDRYYVELTRTGRDLEARLGDSVLDIAQALAVPVVATNDVCFLTAQDFDAHEARVCIHHGRTLDDPRRPREYSAEQYLRSSDDMRALFADIPEALVNAYHIAVRCSVELEFGHYHLPRYPVAAGEVVEDVLRSETRAGFARRVASGSIRRLAADPAHRSQYEERLESELEVIAHMGFAGYFLIVADFIAWAKRHAIPVGPGRGSGAGSLAAFALGITELDPLEYDLLFERFLNPERVSMPDFDVDFCMDRRDEVLEYVAERYGRERVAQIITHGTMAAKAVVRDVGRVLGFPYGFVDQLAKLIPFDPQMTLQRALDEEPMLRQRQADEEDVRAIIALAMRLEGMVRNAGKHAGGVVIAPDDLTSYMPLYCEQGSQALVTQFDMSDVEAIGLVKFDFLGLRTLTIIDWAVRDINSQRTSSGAEPLVVEHIPLDDNATFKLVQSARTTAVFQLESRGMKDLIKRLKPDSFEDMIALVALFRPGPLQSGMVDDFIDRKHGRAAVTYLVPALEPILKPTYGVILYQEQVMQIARVLAGYTLGAADLLRRAMGKKKAEEMAKQRASFVDGAGANGIASADATFIFDLMEKFAGYGFNKSHSAAYALLAYQTAWLKTHHPAAFMSAVLSADMDNTDKVVRLIEECRLLALAVVPPDVNRCGFRFSVADEHTIRYGLGAVKGVGEAVIGALVAERERGGVYVDLADLCRRNADKRFNRRALEALIKAGALDGLARSRAHQMHALEQVLHLADQHQRASAAGQSDFFGLAEAAPAEPATPAVKVGEREWSFDELLACEKETLGLYLSGHPIDRYRAELAGQLSCSLAELKPGKRRVAGQILAVRIIKSRRGRMAVVALDDQTARLEVTVYREVFERNLERLVVDQLVVIEGECGQDEFTGDLSLQAHEIMSIDESRNRLARALVLEVNAARLTNGFVHELQGLIGAHRNGRCPVAIEYARHDSRARLRLGETWRVSLSEGLLEGLRHHFGADHVHLEY